MTQIRKGYNSWYKYTLPKEFGEVISTAVIEERPKWYRPKIMKLYVFTDNGVYVWN